MTEPVVKRGAARRGRKRGLALIVAAIVLATATVAAARLTERPATNPPATATAPEATSGTAYCATLGLEGDAAQLEIASASATEDSQIVITRFVDGRSVSDEPRLLEAGESAVLDIPDDQLSVPIAVEWRDAPVVAQYRRVDGDQEAVANCETRPSDRWYLSGFDTNRGNTSSLYLFNPFGQDAVVELRFGTPQGQVDLVIADEITVPAGEVVARDLAEFRPETADLAVSVIARSGRVIPQGQLVRGPAGEGLEAITGTALVSAAVMPSDLLYVADARSDETVQSWVTVYNPSERDAAVQVQVTTPLDSAEALATELTVPAGGTTRVELADLSALPVMGVSLDSVTGIGLVASRTSAALAGEGAGLATAVAVPTTDRQWTVAGGRSPDSTLSLFNPGSEVASAEVRMAGGEGEGWDAVEVPPNGVTHLRFEDLPAAGPALVTADRPLVAGVSSDGGDGESFWSASGVARTLLSGGGDTVIARRDARLAVQPVVAATATPSVPAESAPEERAPGEPPDPTPTPSFVSPPAVTPTPSPGLGPATRPTVEPAETGPTSTPATDGGPPTTPAPGSPPPTEEGSLFG